MANLNKEKIAEIRTLLASAKHDMEQLTFDEVPEDLREHVESTLKKGAEDLHKVVMDVVEIEEALGAV